MSLSIINDNKLMFSKLLKLIELDFKLYFTIVSSAPIFFFFYQTNRYLFAKWEKTMRPRVCIKKLTLFKNSFT